MEDENTKRRCGQIGEGENDELSMMDVLNEQAQLEAESTAVLGGSDDQNCSYPKGYLDRQALYACATCTTDGLAGVCLACSYECHEGHELHELYTKRNFRCDCGNEKFGTQVCKLYAGKMEPNTKNLYNQNFKGLYCNCSRPFPDPEDSTEDEMIQCIMCEDWLHGRHLKIDLPDKDFSEMICPPCMSKNQFLWAYQVLSEVTHVKKEEEEKDTTQAIKVEESEHADCLCSTQSATNKDKNHTVNEHDAVTEDEAGTSEGISSDVGLKREREESQETKEDECSFSKKMKHDINWNGIKTDVESTKEKSAETNNEVKEETNCNEGKSGDDHEAAEACLFKALQLRSADHPETAAFWMEGWRQKLCHCQQCLNMYKEKDIEYILDESDTMKAYEDRGKAIEASREETEASAALAGMNRVQQIEVVRGMMTMKSKLNEFLQDFAREGKVVTETDIKEFFERMEQQRKKDRLGIPQPFCR